LEVRVASSEGAGGGGGEKREKGEIAGARVGLGAPGNHVGRGFLQIACGRFYAKKDKDLFTSSR
jgi:hypothetical protein